MDKFNKIILTIIIICGLSILGVVIYSAVIGHELAEECRNTYNGHIKPGGYCYYIEDGNSRIYNIWDNAYEGRDAE